MDYCINQAATLPLRSFRSERMRQSARPKLAARFGLFTGCGSAESGIDGVADVSALDEEVVGEEVTEATSDTDKAHEFRLMCLTWRVENRRSVWDFRNGGCGRLCRFLIFVSFYIRKTCCFRSLLHFVRDSRRIRGEVDLDALNEAYDI